MNDLEFQFDWDEGKAAKNVRKHGVSFELASTIFYDPGILTAADLSHGEFEQRWFSIGIASTGTILSVAYLLEGVGCRRRDDSIDYSAASHGQRDKAVYGNQ